jgi:hypothetical protein
VLTLVTLSAATVSLLPGPAAAAPEPAPAETPPTEAPPVAAPPAQQPAPAQPAAAQDPEGALIALGRELELVVTEMGPDQPWTLHLHNRGSAPIGLMADPGLLWFEVAVPGVTASHVCRLPEPLWPKGMRRRAEVVLAPGERFSRRFDPRFFCFSDLLQTTLVPNARVIPHFGWPVETRMATVGGKRVAQPLPPKAPFVAWTLAAGPASASAPPASSDDDDNASDEPSAAPETPWQPPSEGLKNIVGTAIVLSAEYGRWSERAPAATDGLQAAMLAGSDAEDERGALVTVGVGNAGLTPQTVLVRRELISFDVLGPDGAFECPTGDIGPPEVDSFSTLGTRASERLVVRLIEMCPRGGFSRPGLYEVRATWHGKFSGQSAGVDAFVGTITTPRPALVRVRSGERSSFLRAAPMVATGAAAGAPAPGGGQEAPAEGGQETAPAEHEGAPAEEAPALEVPAPEGTSVE